MNKLSFGARLKAALRLVTGSNIIGAFSMSRQKIQWLDQDITSFMDKGYNGNVYVHSTIKQIAQKCSAVDWSLYRVKNKKSLRLYNTKGFKSKNPTSYIRQVKDQALDEVYNHEVNDIIESPNPYQTLSDYVFAHIAYKNIAGNNFTLAVSTLTGENKGKPAEIYNLIPDQLEVVAEPWPGRVLYYKVIETGRRIEPESVLHSKTFNPMNPYVGLSPVAAAIMSVTQSNSYFEWNTSLTQNLGRHPGLFIVKGNAGREQVEQIKNRYREQREDTGMPLVTSGDIKYENLGVNPVDADWLGGMQLTANQIALAFDWPPELIGDSAQKTHANYGQAVKLAYTGKVIPELEALRQDLNRWLVRAWDENLYLDFNTEDIEALQEDRAAVIQRAIAQFSGGLLSLNEARVEMGFDTIPDGDLWLIPIAGKEPLNMLSNDDWMGSANNLIENGDLDNADKELLKDYMVVKSNGELVKT